MSIKVITPGMLSTIQDGGRKGFAAMGFNASGVMDVRSYHIANALVGNFTDEAVIEMTYLGGSFKFLESNTLRLRVPICRLSLTVYPLKCIRPYL